MWRDREVPSLEVDGFKSVTSGGDVELLIRYMEQLPADAAITDCTVQGHIRDCINHMQALYVTMYEDHARALLNAWTQAHEGIGRAMLESDEALRLAQICRYLRQLQKSLNTQLNILTRPQGSALEREW